MISRRSEQILWIATAAAIVTGVTGWVRAEGHGPSGTDPVSAALRAIPRISSFAREAIDSASTSASDRDPFRLTREPSDVPFAPDHDNVSAATPPAAIPPVSVSGIVGPPWVAVLEGVPGHTGSVVAAAGDTLSRQPLAVLVVRRVSRTAVTVAGSDTSWVLMVREPWQ